MKRIGTPWMVAGLLTLSFSAPPSRSFSNEDLVKIRAFWSEPGRYSEHGADGVLVNGPWQPRETPRASQWFWDYNKARKSADLVTSTLWENWAKARLIADRWDAWNTCRQRNRDLFFVDGPAMEPDLPELSPSDPGPAPEDLLSQVGEPPIFSEPVQPRIHDIRFDDVSFSYGDHIKFASPRYSYYRFDHGVRSEGASLKSLPGTELGKLCRSAGISESEGRIMFAVSSLEGGFDAINTYDTGYVSVGFIQFASLSKGANSLGALLADYKQEDPKGFTEDFHRYGIDVDEHSAMVALDINSGDEKVGSNAAQQIIEDKRLIAVFQRAGQVSDGFRVAQLRCAKSMYYPGSESVTVDLADGPVRVATSKLFCSEAGMATLMDRKVNTGHIEGLDTAVAKVCARVVPKKVEDLIPYEKEMVVALKYRKDYLSDPTLTQPAELGVRGGKGLMSRSGTRKGRKKKGQ